jgi:hypothetical protein
MLALNSIISIYETQAEANAGVRDLEQSGFDLKKLSILGREHESGDHVVGYYAVGGHLRYWGARGDFWNGLWKLLGAGGYFVIPNLGGLLVAGPLLNWLIAALKEPVSEELSAMGAGLYGISVPTRSIMRYESAIAMHKLLLVATGNSREMLTVKDVLHRSRPEEINVHFAEEGVQLAA